MSLPNGIHINADGAPYFDDEEDELDPEDTIDFGDDEWTHGYDGDSC